MRRFLFFLYFFSLSFLSFAQERTIISTWKQPENNYVYGVYSQVEGFVVPSYWTDVPFVDWSFVDSLKYKVFDFFEKRVQCDTFIHDVRYAVNFHLCIDTLGRVLYLRIGARTEAIPCFSVDLMKEFRDFLIGFRFHLPEFRGKVHKLYNRNQVNVDSFEFFDLYCSYDYEDKVIFTSADNKLRRQHRDSLLGKWKDLNGDIFEIYEGVDSIPQSIGMFHPLTHQWGRFRYGFGRDQLHIYFGEDSTPVDYRWKENHLVLKGKLQGQEFGYTLTRVQPEKDEK